MGQVPAAPVSRAAGPEERATAGEDPDLSAVGLKVLFDYVFLLATSGWVGGILLGALVFWPIAGGLGPKGELQPLLTRFYQWTALSAALALPALVAVPLAFPELRGPRVGLEAGLAIAAGLALLYAGNVLAPRVVAGLEAGAASDRRVRVAYSRMAAVTAFALGLGMVLLLSFVTRPVPRTTGIDEPSPVERARLESEALRSLGRLAPSAPPGPRSAP